MRILLTDAHSYMTLACLKSFDRCGLQVVVAGASRRDIAFHSNSARHRFVYVSPRASVPRFLEGLAQAVKRYRVDVIIPISEVSLLALAGVDRIANARVHAPDSKLLGLFLSKYKTLRVAMRLGVDVPQTVIVRSGEDPVEKAERAGLAYPLVLKAESTEVRIGDRIERMPSTCYAADAEKLRMEAAFCLARGVRIILQPFVEGSGYGVSGVFSKGSPIALLAHRRIREKQPTGGPSALAETIRLDDRLCLPANRIMRAVGWNGPAMVEFKGDLEGRLNLMEVNARFWGSLPLAEAAGIDFPRIYLDQLKLGPLRAHRRSYRVGIQGRYLLGDTLHLFRVLRGGKTHWPGRLPGRARALASYVKACLSGRVVHLDLIRGDFRPFFARIVSFLVERKGT